MKKLIAIVALCLFPSCSTNMISVDAIYDPVMTVSDRHDDYVRGDETLSEDEQDIYLRTTELLRKILEEASR